MLGTITVIGLMSGTSMDGIDAAIIKTDGYVHVEEIGHASMPYHPYVQQLLKAAEALVREHKGNLAEVRKLDFEKALDQYLQKSLNISPLATAAHITAIKKYLCIDKITFDDVVKLSTDLHSQIVSKILKACHLTPNQVGVIGYHGQTLFHNPKQKITVQIGDGQLLASLTGIEVVNDFRTKDVEAGGQGAPFAPLYHQALAARDGKIPLAVLNCGGISNITVIKDRNPESLIGFDPGPGNSLVDRFVQLRTQGKETMDLDGKHGQQGKVDPFVLEALRQKSVWKNGQNYLLKFPPKSLDVGDLGLISDLELLSLEDGCATLEAFTANAIVQSLAFIQPPYPKHWILAGGGWYNPVIKKELTHQLKDKIGQDTDIRTADEAGWNSRALEAQIFAYLAVRHLKGLPTSYPQTTGVPRPIVGGQHFKPQHCDPKALVDLSNVATEQKCAEYANIENLSLEEQFARLFQGMVHAVQVIEKNKIPILSAVEQVYLRWQNIPVQNRRLYMVGAGTSGRLAAITSAQMAENGQFHLDFDIAGGPTAFQKAVEGAEDDENLAKADVEHRKIDKNTIVIGLSASGRTPYAIAYLEAAKAKGALTIAIDNSPGSLLSKAADLTLSNNTGPECPRGSTRMKAGTSQYITLQLLIKLLIQALCQNNKLEELFDLEIDNIKSDMQLAKKTQTDFINSAHCLHTHLMNAKNTSGRIVYTGKGTRGLLGAIDGSELGPTYSWVRVGYATSALSKVLKKTIQPTTISPHDFVVSLDGNSNFPCPYIDLGHYRDSVVNIQLKILTTLFALQSGWILKGEMIHLDPKNPNKKLIARRVQILKNLEIAQTDQQALKILENTGNDLVLAIRKKN